jgi:hypothetical protein
MKKVKTIIGITTGMVFIYVITASLSGNFSFIFLLFLICTVLFFYMVITILKDGTPSHKKFDDYFYDDVDIKN